MPLVLSNNYSKADKLAIIKGRNFTRGGLAYLDILLSSNNFDTVREGVIGFIFSKRSASFLFSNVIRVASMRFPGNDRYESKFG